MRKFLLKLFKRRKVWIFVNNLVDKLDDLLYATEQELKQANNLENIDLEKLPSLFGKKPDEWLEDLTKLYEKKGEEKSKETQEEIWTWEKFVKSIGGV